MIDDTINTYIYESPDGGNTIYRRPFGSDSSQRHLHSISKTHRRWQQKKQQLQLLQQVVDAAESDPELKEMIEKAIIYHQLKSQP